jgi:hypothetical protein
MMKQADVLTTLLFCLRSFRLPIQKSSDQAVRLSSVARPILSFKRFPEALCHVLQPKPDKLDPEDVADAVFYAISAQQKTQFVKFILCLILSHCLWAALLHFSRVPFIHFFSAGSGLH